MKKLKAILKEAALPFSKWLTIWIALFAAGLAITPDTQNALQFSVVMLAAFSLAANRGSL